MPHMLTGSLLAPTIATTRHKEMDIMDRWMRLYRLIYYTQAVVCASMAVMKIDFAQGTILMMQCYSAIYRQTALRETGTMRVKCVIVFTCAWLCTVGYGKNLLHS